MSSDLKVRGLTVEYASGDTVVRPLCNLDLDVAAGTTVLLLGPSGCGKTTLLSCLAGILTPTAGSIAVGDTCISELQGRQLTAYRRSGVGVVFQSFNLVPSLTALENVVAPLLAAHVPFKRAAARAADLLEEVDMAQRGHQHPSTLSGGQQQRVAIARALVADPPLLLADEPTAHLDQIQVDGILALLRRLANSQRIMIVATHDPRVMALSDHVLDLGPRTTPPAPLGAA